MSRRSCPGAPINQSHLSGRAILCSLLSAQKMKCRCRSIFSAIYIRKISKINPSDIIQITIYLHKKIFKSCSQTWKTAKTFNWKLENSTFIALFLIGLDWFCCLNGSVSQLGDYTGNRVTTEARTAISTLSQEGTERCMCHPTTTSPPGSYMDRRGSSHIRKAGGVPECCLVL